MRYTFNTKRGKYSGEPEKCICFLFFGTKARFEPKARKSWLDKTDAYPLVYVSIWTASFDAVFGQRLRLPKNATAFFGSTTINISPVNISFISVLASIVFSEAILPETAIQSVTIVCGCTETGEIPLPGLYLPNEIQ